MADQPILELKNVYSSYGSIKALKGISLKVYPGEIVAIIGANGAGKSTTLMATCCVIPIDQGEIWYDGSPIHGTAAEVLPKTGLCQVPEGRRIFPRLTVDENLTLGAFFRKNQDDIAADRQYVYKLFPILKDRHKQHGGTLSGGEQQMLAIARALMG
ncbi:MAG: ATP-binding cassette domain-containing protein, partial [Desulfosarcina sp.]